MRVAIGIYREKGEGTTRSPGSSSAGQKMKGDAMDAADDAAEAAGVAVSITVALNICIETAMRRATPTAKGHPGDADVSSSTSS